MTELKKREIVNENRDEDEIITDIKKLVLELGRSANFSRLMERNDDELKFNINLVLDYFGHETEINRKEITFAELIYLVCNSDKIQDNINPYNYDSETMFEVEDNE